jgi:NTE family protein
MVEAAETFPLPRPVAFAFSGGMSLGAIHVGMLSALEERGIAPDLLVGSSVGAVNAAFIGSGYGPERIATLASIWSRVRFADVFGPPGLPRYIRALGGRGSLAAPASLRALLDRHLPARHSDLSIPTAAIATDLVAGDAVVLEDGDLRENVMASAAIPGVFPSVEIGGRVLADGGIAAHLPVLQAAALGAASVVVLDTGYPCALTERPRGLIQNVVHLVNLVLHQQSSMALTMLGARCPVLYLPSPCPLDVAPWDFTQSAKLIERGHAASSRFLGTLRLRGPGVYGHPHLLHPGAHCEEPGSRWEGQRTPRSAPIPPPSPAGRQSTVKFT